MVNKTSYAKASVPAPAFLHSGGSKYNLPSDGRTKPPMIADQSLNWQAIMEGKMPTDTTISAFLSKVGK